MTATTMTATKHDHRLWPSWFVAIIAVAVFATFVAVIVENSEFCVTVGPVTRTVGILT